MSARRWEYKIVADTAVPGGFVRLSQTAVAIVDTPHFQRLRYLKQLGLTDLVYPNATHTRFAHSLGVAHRAREVLQTLQRRQPELGITDSDIQVVEIAGLCHDLGHGPFSHAFEGELLPRVLPGSKWCHEDMSCRLFDHICAQYTIPLDADQQQRVKDLMGSGHRQPQADWKGKEFMFDIVANKRNGLDVDKFDYLRRDTLAVGDIAASEFHALFESMRVIRGHICFKASRRSTVLDVYASRARLHEMVYTHAACKAAELMVVDALVLVAEELGIAAAVQDPELFALLDDTVVRQVERSPSPSQHMKHAQQLLHRLRHRDIYKMCGSVDVPQAVVESLPKPREEDVLAHQDASCGVTLLPSDVRMHNLVIDFTMRSRNPLQHVGFYENDDDDDFFTLEETPFAPGTYMTRQVRIYLVRLCGDAQEKQRYMAAVQRAFGRWCEQVLKAARWRSPHKSALTPRERKRKREGVASAQPPLSPSCRMHPPHTSAPAGIAGTAARASAWLGTIHEGAVQDCDEGGTGWAGGANVVAAPAAGRAMEAEGGESQGSQAAAVASCPQKHSYKDEGEEGGGARGTGLPSPPDISRAKRRLLES